MKFCIFLPMGGRMSEKKVGFAFMSVGYSLSKDILIRLMADGEAASSLDTE